MGYTLPFDETLANFRHHDFDSRIQRSDATSLEDACRTHLRSIYNIDPPGDSSDTKMAGARCLWTAGAELRFGGAMTLLRVWTESRREPID